MSVLGTHTHHTYVYPSLERNRSPKVVKNTALKHIRRSFIPFSLVILHCLGYICCQDYLGCLLLKN